MQARSTLRRPDTYGEHETPELSGRAAVSRRTVPSDPNLPVTLIPAVDLHDSVNSRATSVIDAPTRSETSNGAAKIEKGALRGRATIVRSKQQALEQGMLPTSSGAASGEVETSQLETSKLQDWDLVVDDGGQLGDLDGLETMDEEEEDESALFDLIFSEEERHWADLTDGLKLIVTLELTAGSSFKEAVKKLRLTSNDKDEIISLFEIEVSRQQQEYAIPTSILGPRSHMQRGQDSAISRGTSGPLKKDISEDLKESPLWPIRKRDIVDAQRFLECVKLDEYAERLWLYYGNPPLTWVITDSKRNGSSSTVKSLTQVEQYDVQTLGDADMSSSNSKRKDMEDLHEDVDKAPTGAVCAKGRHVNVAENSPRGNGHPLSDDLLEGIVAANPLALQSTSVPRKSLASISGPRQPRRDNTTTFSNPRHESSPTLGNRPKTGKKPPEHSQNPPTPRKQPSSLREDRSPNTSPLKMTSSAKNPNSQSLTSKSQAVGALATKVRAQGNTAAANSEPAVTESDDEQYDLMDEPAARKRRKRAKPKTLLERKKRRESPDGRYGPTGDGGHGRPTIGGVHVPLTTRQTRQSTKKSVATSLSESKINSPGAAKKDEEIKKGDGSQVAGQKRKAIDVLEDNSELEETEE